MFARVQLKLTRRSVESELAAINKRLDHLASLLTSTSRSLPVGARLDDRNSPKEYGVQDDSPYFLLGTSSMMHALGLNPDFAQELLRMERSAAPINDSCGTRLFIQQHQAAVALAAFSDWVHVWYPILQPGFSEHYFRTISGPLNPSAETCLVLLIAAIGCLAQYDTYSDALRKRPDKPYFEAALTSLPVVITECSMTSVQCLLLFSIYHCCILKVCQAHDYSLMASHKIQNFLKGHQAPHSELPEHAKRAFWAALLLENELATQFDVAQSGIWALDERIALPSAQKSWHFALEATSPLDVSASPESGVSISSDSVQKVQSYCLAEIAMRRMLHRCNSAVTRKETGHFVYAPAIALELELQLQEWYNYLPRTIRFDVEADHRPTSPGTFQSCPLTAFLRVQYHCCKIAIYWPAVYQTIEDGEAEGQLLDHCRRYFDSYIQLIPCIKFAFETCIVNRWTLFLR